MIAGGFNYTNFKGVNFKNTAFIRVETDGGFNGTVSMPSSDDASRAYRFPAKSGTFPIMGTFAVQFPVITSTSNIYSTVVTVAGIRDEDALVVQLNSGTHATRDVFAVGSGSTARILNAVKPGDGQITMGFLNLGQTTGYTELIYSYLAMR